LQGKNTEKVFSAKQNRSPNPKSSSPTSFQNLNTDKNLMEKKENLSSHKTISNKTTSTKMINPKTSIIKQIKTLLNRKAETIR
jgi:hypothetical protein